MNLAQREGRASAVLGPGTVQNGLGSKENRLALASPPLSHVCFSRKSGDGPPNRFRLRITQANRSTSLKLGSRAAPPQPPPRCWGANQARGSSLDLQHEFTGRGGRSTLGLWGQSSKRIRRRSDHE